jgi:hypothetical protein
MCGVVVLCAVATPPTSAGLRIIRTQHYEMHTDLPDDFANDLAVRMDAMYEEYSKRLSDFAQPTDAQRLQVYLFDKHADYIAFTKNEHTAGVFAPGEKSYLASFLEGQGREEMRHTLQHEAFHQFAYFVVSPNLPTWLNEGIAELYNDAIWTGNRYIIGEIYPRRVRRLEEDIKNHNFVHFDKMIAMDHKTWNEALSAKDETATTYYNQAWAMLYFLTQSGPSAQPKQMTAYLKQLHGGADPASAWKTFFPDTKLLESQFANWVTRVDPTPGGTLIERMSVLGDFYIYATQHGVQFNTITDFRNLITRSEMRITYKVGSVSWRTDRPDLYFRNLRNDLWKEQELYFEPRQGTYPDIVCIADKDTALCQRFHGPTGGAPTEHELLFNIGARASGSNVQMRSLQKGSGPGGLH